VNRRVRTLSVAGVLALVLFLVALFLPVPYVALGPGEADDVLGQDPRVPAEQVIAVSGAPTYPTSGRLLLTTVSVGTGLSLGEALLRWGQAAYAVVPRTVVYPPQRSQSDTEKRDRADMVASQDSSTVAALSLLGIPRVVRVAGFSAGSRAQGPLKTDDELLTVGGTPVPSLEALRAAVTALPAGEPVTLGVRRDGKPLTVQVTTGSVQEASGQRTVLGASVQLAFTVDVRINLSLVGGPSAGLMYALGILDKLTPGSLTGGKVIAGTGTIDADGTVGIIGGIQQKLRGARQRGATAFLVPAGNCAEAVGAGVDGLQLVQVPAKGGLTAARDDVTQLAAGDTRVPAC